MSATMAGSQSPELAKLFDVCQRIEMAHAQLYRVLAEAHAADASIAALWRKTANEEDGHAAQFRLAANYSESIQGVAVDLAQATEMLQTVEATVRRMRAQPPGITDALRIAIRMEEAMERLHMDQLVQFGNSAHQRLFRAMMGVDQAHVQSLRDALARVEG
jgi:rubrerythrin